MKNEIFNHRWLAHLAATIRERFDLAEDNKRWWSASAAE